MDAAGNLTDISEFDGARWIRLVSYLNPDLAIGVFPGPGDGTYNLGLRNISAGEPEKSIFRVSISPYVPDPSRGPDLFMINWEYGTDAFLYWADNGERLEMADHYTADGDVHAAEMDRPHDFAPTAFAADFVDGCWFALNDPPRNHVVDCSGSGTASGNPIIAWPWNGGENQLWRAATKGPGLD